jgi:hypothetical protein
VAKICSYGHCVAAALLDRCCDNSQFRNCIHNSRVTSSRITRSTRSGRTDGMPSYYQCLDGRQWAPGPPSDPHAHC